MSYMKGYKKSNEKGKNVEEKRRAKENKRKHQHRADLLQLPWVVDKGVISVNRRDYDRIIKYGC